MNYDVVIIGAGAAGMMCAAHCGGNALIVDHAKAAGEKVRISGGGRCNFTNMGTSSENFISNNAHFCKSALKRYTQWDFLSLVERHNIAWHEKTLGQLFCDGSAKEIVAMMLAEMAQAGVDLRLKTSVRSLDRLDAGGFQVALETDGHQYSVQTARVVLATGGKSIPKMGATGFAYDIAAQFGLPVTPIRPALVPLTFSDGKFAEISGVSTPARINAGPASFEEALLFTHRGLSGPAILQASSYWQDGDPLHVNLDPAGAFDSHLKTMRQQDGKKAISTILAQVLPTRLIGHLAADFELTGRLGDQSDKAIDTLCAALRGWTLAPTGTEGYRTAEVTLGGIDTDALSSKTMEAKQVPGLYVIGEASDVTGWLGGYNFQWAWSSGWAAGTAISAAL